MPPGRPGVHCNSSCPGNEVGKVQVIELECTAGNLCWCSRRWCTVPHEVGLGFRGCASAVHPRWRASPPRVGPRCASLWWKDSCDRVVVSFLLSRTLTMALLPFSTPCWRSTGRNGCTGRCAIWVPVSSTPGFEEASPTLPGGSSLPTACYFLAVSVGMMCGTGYLLSMQLPLLLILIPR